ncbi:MAG: hypothetical protein COA67_06975 [Lutibacter sp.]|nr:MAG: hypothetical protein COA67_06975 [Lutibacter sp.]
MSATFYTNAQEVTYKDIKFKHKKGFVVVNKKNVLKLKYSAGYFYIYDLNSNDELMYFHINDNETFHYMDDDYVKVFFTNSEKILESKSHHRVVMAQLINEKVFDSEWNIDEDKIDKFIKKYDENISNRTIRN